MDAQTGITLILQPTDALYGYWHFMTTAMRPSELVMHVKCKVNGLQINNFHTLKISKFYFDEEWRLLGCYAVWLL
jgi:hypothetical protein